MGRFTEAHLKKWREKIRRKPLALRGVRQVGKAILVS